MKELATALAKAQVKFRIASKSSENPFYKSRYADLAEVISVVREPLAENGLSFVQTAQALGETWVLKTILLHTSGESVEGYYPIITSKQDAQGFGAAVTYARRFALQAMLGVAADEDDDGNTASGKSPVVEPKASQLIDDIRFEMARNGWTNKDVQEYVKKTYGRPVSSLNQFELTGLKSFLHTNPATKQA